MVQMSFTEFRVYYIKYGKTPNQISQPKNLLNENQLKSRYNKYLNSQEKKVAANKRHLKRQYVAKVLPKEIDEKWSNVRREAYHRDGNRCQLLPYAPDIRLYGNILGPLDPCHIFRRSTYPHMKYDLENIVILHRLFHSRLDQYKDPFTGRPITFDETYIWWKKIVGSKRFYNLQQKTKER